MPLTFVNSGEPVEVTRVSGDEKTRRHLHNLGFVEGCEVKVISESLGNLIVKVRDARIALSKELARKIIVTPI